MIPVNASLLATCRDTFIARTGLGTPSYTITPRSPWPSELFALYALGVACGVNRWLEGGTYHGQAAEVLHRASGVPVTTVEINDDIAKIAKRRLAPHERIDVIVGDGQRWIPDIADRERGPVGVFLDGPKGFDAAVLAHLLLSKRPSVAFVGCHDMSQSVPGRAVPARAALEELGRYEPHLWTFWATDDPEYVAWSRSMDDGLHAQHASECSGSGWRPFERFAEGQPTMPSPSYGPTVAFLIRA